MTHARPSRLAPPLLLLLLPVVSAFAQPDELEADAPRRVTFTERSKFSSLESQQQRLRFNSDNPHEDYNLAEESFIQWLPANYDGSEAFGLLVWVSPSGEGYPPRGWRDVLQRHRLLWIGANNAGNPRDVLHRFGLALDGRDNMVRLFNVDPQRIYIAGMSGGSRVASRMGLTWADLFSGALMNDGVDYYTVIRVPGRNDAVWRPTFYPPPAGVLAKAKRDNRYVLVTGENDPNKPQTLATFHDGYERAGFRHVTYFEVPGKGHAIIDGEWFEKAVVELDKPIGEAHDEPARAEATSHEAAPAPQEEDRESAARQLYQLATNYLAAKRPDLARPYLRRVVDDYGDTSYAGPAQQRLEEIE